MYLLIYIFKYTERTNDKGETIVTNDDTTTGLGFCPDLQPDFNVGVAMPGLLIASADVAYDLVSLQKYNVTHILNVAAGLPNAFGNVSKSINCMFVLNLDADRNSNI